MDSRVGRVLQDRYKILARIAEGAMGTVYRAEQFPLGRAVAVKFMHRRLAADPVLLKRFEVEAQAGSITRAVSRSPTSGSMACPT
jgi:serine/threonine protein kinase